MRHHHNQQIDSSTTQQPRSIQPPPSHLDTSTLELDFLRQGTKEGEGVKDWSNAPLLTRAAFLASYERVFPYKTLMGSVLEQRVGRGEVPLLPQSPQLYLNVSEPFSTVICGVQGSGKSHSLSTILENVFIRHPVVGDHPSKLAGLVLHYSHDSSTFGQPCEAACLSSLDPLYAQKGIGAPPEVIVLVSPSSLSTMRRVYSSLPHVKVFPLSLAPVDLNSSRIVDLMANKKEGNVPLYMTSILSLLRAQGADNFDYRRLPQEIEALRRKLNPAQNQGLTLRLALLEGFVTRESKKMKATSIKSYFAQGRLVIIDLSDPFLGEAAACVLFDVVVGLFLESVPGCGKIIALDEAHTFLTSSSSDKLVATLISNIRLQRHLGLRTIISTQEPTCIPPEILDLVSFILTHRFSSPAWAYHLDKHVASQEEGGGSLAWFDRVSSLDVGQALLFSPTSIVWALTPASSSEEEEGKGKGKEKEMPVRGEVVRAGRGYLLVEVRKRLTSDGGLSTRVL